jgi:hypothetical protein
VFGLLCIVRVCDCYIYDIIQGVVCVVGVGWDMGLYQPSIMPAVGLWKGRECAGHRGVPSMDVGVYMMGDGVGLFTFASFVSGGSV